MSEKSKEYQAKYYQENKERLNKISNMRKKERWESMTEEEKEKHREKWRERQKKRKKREIDTDCQFYSKKLNECNALKMLYCLNGKCGFYKRREGGDG